MAQNKQRKTIHYKRATFMKNGESLQDLIEAAYTKMKKASQRKEPINQEEGIYRLWNERRSSNGMVFGNLVVYAEDKDQPLITLDNQAKEFKISQLTPPRKDGNKQEFLESILYFGILENHVLILQSSSLRARELELYFNWFLREKTDVMEKENGVFLNDHLTKKTLKKMEKTPVKSVSIGAPLSSENDQDKKTEVDTDVRSAKKIQFVPKGMGFDVIRAALGQSWFDNLKLEDSLDEANLQVKLEVTYLRKTTKNAHKLLNNIATSLRHTEPDDVTVYLDGGGKLKGDDLKLFHPVNVNTNNGVVENSDLFDQMYQWLSSLIKKSLIDA